MCSCQAFSGLPCEDTHVAAGGRCRRHGGASLAGMASGTFKHGRWSTYLPAGLAERFTEGMADPFLMQIRQDVALTDALLTAYTQKLKAGKPLTRTQETRIVNLSEHRRKLIESDAKRQRELQQMVPVERVMQLVASLTTAVHELVPKELLPAIQARIRQLLMVQGATIDVPKEPEHEG